MARGLFFCLVEGFEGGAKRRYLRETGYEAGAREALKGLILSPGNFGFHRSAAHQIINSHPLFLKFSQKLAT